MIKNINLAKLYYLILLIIFSNVAKAAIVDKEVFHVYDIHIYAESIDNYDAKTEAIRAGVANSFEVLAKRILSEEDYWKIDSFKLEDAYECLKDVKLSEERMTAFSYRAKGDYYYNPMEVKKLFNRMGLFFISNYSSPKLVIPILKKDNEFTIWEDSEWMSAWGAMPSDYGLLKLNYLIGDLTDEYYVDPAKANNAQYNYFNKIMHKYEVDELFIITGVEEDNTFKLIIKHLTTDFEKSTMINFTFQSQINTEEFYQYVANEALKEMDIYYKHFNSFE